MAHAAARRRCPPGNEACHGFLAFRSGNELGRVFLRRAADLADHDDRLRLVIGEEHLQHVDEFGALHRIAADADSRRLAKPLLGRLEHGFISKRARARYNAHRTLSEDIARHDADLALVGCQHTRAIRTDQPRLRSDKRPLHLHHVQDRNAFGDGDDQRDLGIDGFEDGVGGKWRRHIDDSGIGSGLLLGVPHGIENRQPHMRGPALARRHTANHPRAIGNRLLGMKRPIIAGNALADDLGRGVDENGHEAVDFRQVFRNGLMTVTDP